MKFVRSALFGRFGPARPPLLSHLRGPKLRWRSFEDTRFSIGNTAGKCNSLLPPAYSPLIHRGIATNVMYPQGAGMHWKPRGRSSHLRVAIKCASSLSCLSPLFASARLVRGPELLLMIWRAVRKSPTASYQLELIPSTKDEEIQKVKSARRARGHIKGADQSENKP